MVTAVYPLPLDIILICAWKQLTYLVQFWWPSPIAPLLYITTENRTMIYAASGKGILVTNPGSDDELQRHELSAGDFALIPPWTEHQEINETDENVVWVLVRTGPEPVVVYLTGWGGSEAPADSTT
ncbi:hypothetical protein F4810DRAFT_710089 [Camillea tinctor]|nr:hypothetical protein F4810DRAFT_710089 [Camillea tinctor]